MIDSSLEPIYRRLPQSFFNAVTLVEIAVEKSAAHVLMPISARKQMNDLPDEVLTTVTFYYCSDPRDALIKSLAE